MMGKTLTLTPYHNKLIHASWGGASSVFWEGPDALAAFKDEEVAAVVIHLSPEKASCWNALVAAMLRHADQTDDFVCQQKTVFCDQLFPFDETRRTLLVREEKGRQLEIVWQTEENLPVDPCWVSAFRYLCHGQLFSARQKRMLFRQCGLLAPPAAFFRRFSLF